MFQQRAMILERGDPHVVENERITKLTQRQKDCLRLVAQGYTSKQIGRQLGISYSTVDNHLQAAVLVTGLSGRAEAGRMLARFDQAAEHSQELPSEPPAVAESPTSNNEGRRAAPQSWVPRVLQLLPPIGGTDNDLTTQQRLIAVGRIAILSAVSFLACVIVIRMCFRIFA